MSAIDVDKIQTPMRETHASGLNLSYEWRVKQLKSLRRLIAENKVLLCQALKSDLGRHHGETLAGELKPIENEIKFVLKNLKKWMKAEAVPSSATMFPGFSYVHRKPLAAPGVLIIGPFNYPFFLTLKPLIGAFAGGNPAVIKPSELCMESGKIILELFSKYFQPGAAQVVLGSIPETNALLEKSWGKVFFTGSQRVGKIVASACAMTLTPIILELGGKCPVVVDENIRAKNLQNVADRIIFTKTYNAGQTCVAPDTLFVHDSHVKELCTCLINAIETQFGKDPKQGELGRIVNAASAKRLQEMILEAEGDVTSSVVCGSSAECDTAIRYICPTLILNPKPGAKVLKEEIFGPILPIVTFSSRSEVFKMINGLGSHPLQFTVFTSQHKVFEEYTKKCPSSAAFRNDCLVQLSNHNLPFGGLGGSGIGHYSGKYSFDAFTHPFPSTYRPLGKFWDLNNLRCHPYGDWKGKFLDNHIIGLPDIPVLHMKRLVLSTALAAALASTLATVDEFRFAVAQCFRWIADQLHE
ncbi:unnamed protein product [Cylindrotheca closterium]|uniref:Aldehyde dehydrogenase n=1 Tax=Cylindrotheca closterium TaxID=2856 RepID=A0AAD2CNE6_9STRA|nr:unnamed protein product [Cylindrotheca closterium]